MNESLANPAQRVLLGAGTEASVQRASSHLSVTALLHPLFQTPRPRPQNGGAFRVGNHWLHTCKLNLVQRLVHRGWDRKLVELHKKKMALVDAIWPGIFAQRREILRIEMK